MNIQLLAPPETTSAARHRCIERLDEFGMLGGEPEGQHSNKYGPLYVGVSSSCQLRSMAMPRSETVAVLDASLTRPKARATRLGALS